MRTPAQALAHTSAVQENHCCDMQASDKFKMALDIEPRKHDALWCLGNAYTSQVMCPVVQIPAVMLSHVARKFTGSEDTALEQ